nr:hypothetical protein [Tanacetum cinerariifolium]
MGIEDIASWDLDSSTWGGCGEVIGTIQVYVSESQQAAVQNSNSPEQQDALILAVIKQLKTQIVNCTKINLDNKSVNDTLTTEIERYKDQVRILKEGQNVDLKSKDIFLDSCVQSKEESRNIDREIALGKQIKELNNNVSKRNQSSQTKAQQLEPNLYDGNDIQKTNAIVIRGSEETLMLVEESRSKMILKQKDPLMSEKKVNTTLNSKNSPEPTSSTRPTQAEVPKDLPKVSMVNMSLKKLKHHLASFDVEKVLVITALKDNLRKLKGKAIVDEAVISYPINQEMMKVDIATLAPKLRNNRTVHSDYLKHTQELLGK